MYISLDYCTLYLVGLLVMIMSYGFEVKCKKGLDSPKLRLNEGDFYIDQRLRRHMEIAHFIFCYKTFKLGTANIGTRQIISRPHFSER